MSTTPNVFIVESLKFEDEDERREGDFLAHIIKQEERKCAYYYIRTKTELEAVLDRFQESGFRYLHISCHADKNGLQLTLDHLRIEELGELLRPYIDHRRVFFSACELASETLAAELLSTTDCYSVAAPAERTAFGQAALFWASLYHLMFRDDKTEMKRDDLSRNLIALSELFDLSVRYFSKSGTAAEGFKEVPLRVGPPRG